MEQSSLIQRVQNALDEIRPFLNNDGGDIELVAIENDIVKVRLLGNCTECSINRMTLKSGVEMIVKEHAPEISKVINMETKSFIMD